VTIRLLSYNVRYFGHALKGLASTAGAKARIARAVVSLQQPADLIALQEVETRSLRAHAVHRGASATETQLEAFMRHLRASHRAAGLTSPYQPWYFPAHVYRVGALRLYTTGLAVLVNTQTLSVLRGNHAQPHAVTHHGSKRLKQVKQTRIAAHLELETGAGQRFHLFNTHLSLPTPWAKTFWAEPRKMGHGRNQLAEAEEVMRYATETSAGAPCVIAGDFNSAPATPVYRAFLAQGFTGAQETVGQIDAARPAGFATAGFLALRMHLDHVFGRGVEWIDVEGTRGVEDRASPFFGLSDHVPQLCRFALPPAKR
jgi:endonuclease/exonuclease/phosphatase family metal-dependent hydrolase